MKTPTKNLEPTSIQAFEAEIFRMENLGWTGIIVGFNVRKVFGVKGFLRVRGTLDGLDFSGHTLIPAGDGAFMMSIRKEEQKRLGKGPGKMVSVTMELDLTPITVPSDFMTALEAEPAGLTFFESLSDGNKRHFIHWIEAAKRQPTRDARIAESIAKLCAKKKWWQD